MRSLQAQFELNGTVITAENVIIDGRVLNFLD